MAGDTAIQVHVKGGAKFLSATAATCTSATHAATSLRLACAAAVRVAAAAAAVGLALAAAVVPAASSILPQTRDQRRVPRMVDSENEHWVHPRDMPGLV